VPDYGPYGSRKTLRFYSMTNRSPNRKLTATVAEKQLSYKSDAFPLAQTDSVRTLKH